MNRRPANARGLTPRADSTGVSGMQSRSAGFDLRRVDDGRILEHRDGAEAPSSGPQPDGGEF